ncbi:MAG: PIN domain-containing protein [Armatimonadota bacterium]|nr:PIN domain-containing protein [Armatimonadota bacterium]
MILVDANLLLYAYAAGSPRHAEARAWLEGVLSGPRPVRLAWATVQAFLRLSTHPRIFERPFSIDEACAIVEEWFTRPTVATLQPGDRHWEILRTLLRAAQARGDVVADAHLAALAIEHGATLCTTDRDFVRFPDLTFENPLA